MSRELFKKNIFLKRPVKSSRKWKTYSTLLILTTALIIFYGIQTSYLNSFLNMRHGRKIEKDSDPKNEDYSESLNIKFEGGQLVHFDFKGAPPKVSYLLNFIPFIKRLGASGVLLEYEDMFPYYGRELKIIPAANAYTPSDIAKIVKALQKNNLTIIPLIPTIGHFEFVLKLQEFKGFREVEDDPQVICPSQSKIYPILYKMIDQIMEAHPTSNYLHIGGDDANFKGVCPKCKQFMKSQKLQKQDIYFNHVKKLAQYIVATYPEVRPIVWGDKFLEENKKTIIKNGIPDLVDVMLRNYRTEEHTFPREVKMNSLVRMLKNIWIAGAFKGATGSTQIVTDADHHFRNVKAWLVFVNEWKNKINFKGIALIGWQRYGHFSVLCELLPVAIPSLALSLQYLKNTKKQGVDQVEIKKALDCNNFVPLNLSDTENKALMSRLQCRYPGYKIYKIIHSFHNARTDLTILLKKLNYGDMSFYNVIHNTSSPSYVRQLDMESFKKLLIIFNKMENNIKAALSELYDHHTVNEWILTYFLPQQMRLEAALNILATLKSRKVWSRRPLPDITTRVKQFFNETCGKAEKLGCTLFNFV